MKITRALIQKYHQGLCNSQEKQAVEEWLLSDAYDGPVNIPAPENKAGTEERIWNNVRKNTLDKRRAAISIRQLSGIAACTITLALGGYFLYKNRHSGLNSDSPHIATAYQTITVGRGKKGSLTLPDGTKVTLNAGSELSYPATFTGNTREVKLTGEAYFQVTARTQPFIIHTTHTHVTVLGTAFNVKAYATDEATTVVVKEGKVRFSSTTEDQGLILTANQRGSYKNGHLEKEVVKTASYMRWQQNILSFEDEPLENVLLVLERWYDMPVQITDPQLKKQHFSGQFQNQTIEEVISNITFVMNCHYSHQKNAIRIYK